MVDYCWALLQICRWHYSSDVSLVLEKTCHTLDRGPSWLLTSCLWSSVKAGVGSLFHHDWGSSVMVAKSLEISFTETTAKGGRLIHFLRCDLG